jgi:hypothetical protein
VKTMLWVKLKAIAAMALLALVSSVSMNNPIDVYAVEQTYWDSFYPKAEPVATTKDKYP